MPPIVRSAALFRAKNEALKSPRTATRLVPVKLVLVTELPISRPTSSEPVSRILPFVAVNESSGACCVPGIVIAGATMVSTVPAAILPSASWAASVNENAPVAEPVTPLTALPGSVSVTELPFATTTPAVIGPPGWVIEPVASRRSRIAMPVRSTAPSIVTDAADADGVVAPDGTLVKPPMSSVPPLV